jgi:thioredoxin-related protein
MKKLFLAFMFVLLMAVPVEALQLLMFSTERCGFCRAFIEEVAPTYHKSEYAKHLPLKIIDIDQPPPMWVQKAFDEFRLTPINQTPTFVIWKDKEVARLIGYVGKEKFYESIGAFIEENTGDFKEPPKRGPMDEFGSRRVPPPGVINSRDLFQHMYKTPKEALKASDWFGCHGNIHYHKDENVWMPCSME